MSVSSQGSGPVKNVYISADHNYEDVLSRAEHRDQRRALPPVCKCWDAVRQQMNNSGKSSRRNVNGMGAGAAGAGAGGGGGDSSGSGAASPNGNGPSEGEGGGGGGGGGAAAAAGWRCSKCQLQRFSTELDPSARMTRSNHINATTRAFRKAAMEAVVPTVEDLRNVRISHRMTFDEANSELDKYNQLVERLFSPGSGGGSCQGQEQEVLVRRSTLLCLLEQWEEAAHDAAAALELQPNYPVAHYRLGCACFGAGDFEGASEAFRAGLKLSPASKDLRRAMDTSLQALRRRIKLPDCGGVNMMGGASSVGSVGSVGSLGSVGSGGRILL